MSIHKQSEARRLRPRPCAHCSKMSRIERRAVPEMVANVDPDVSVFWYCPDNLCPGHDGFGAEEQ
ncbi:hypothetical protein [Streptomyces sp. NPDC002853]